jgi:hypothetical protein
MYGFRRKILIGVLALGALGGFASGVFSFARCRAHSRAAFERHVAKVCVDAAKTASKE